MRQYKRTSHDQIIQKSRAIYGEPKNSGGVEKDSINSSFVNPEKKMKVELNEDNMITVTFE